jgi:rRNA maturation RNase YbeY
LGIVSIYDEQEALKEIDEAALRTTVQRISKILGYETYDVTLLLVDDEEMRETNLESRGIDKPTDILSFPFHECQPYQAGLLEEPEFDVPDYYTLGDLVVDVPYVIRRCKEDLMLHEELEMVGSGSRCESNQEGGTSQKTGEEDAFLPVEEEDRGVSGAMARVEDPEKRIRMLLVHGMLHLVGYDHIEDSDYIEMVEREEELLKELGEL